MAIALTYGGLNLNDGSTYIVLEPVDVGERQKTWSEYRGLDGTVAQTNVSEASLIEMHFPIEVHGSSVSDLDSKITAINTLIDAGAQTLAFNDGSGAVNYSCLHSPRVGRVHDIRSDVGFYTVVELVLFRIP